MKVSKESFWSKTRAQSLSNGTFRSWLLERGCRACTGMHHGATRKGDNTGKEDRHHKTLAHLGVAACSAAPGSSGTSWQQLRITCGPQGTTYRVWHLKRKAAGVGNF